LKTLGENVFVAILAFGASSYIGLIAAALAFGSSINSLLQGKVRITVYVLAYVVTGLIGSYLSLRILRTIKAPKLQK
jgi:hypothetical protein